MRPISLTLHNFGSFHEPQTLYFPTEPGLYFMWGENQVEPRLEANGSGKSTVWKAITWLFFERTAAGLKAGDVCNWDAGKGTSVSLNFEDAHGIPHTVTRCWSPNKWMHIDGTTGQTHDLAKSSENHVLAMLQLNFTAFTQTVIMPQDSELFMELKGDTQTALFSDVMNLDRWVKYSDRASARARETDIECRRLERELANVQGKLVAAQGANIWEGDDIWKKEHDRKLDELDAEHARLTARYGALTRSLHDAEDADRDARAELARAADTKLLDERLDAAIAKHDQLRGAAQRKEGENNALCEKRELLRGHDVCPTCDQPLGKDSSTARSIQEHLDKCVAEIMEMWREEEVARKSVDDLRATRIQRNKRIQQEQDIVMAASRDLRDVRADLARTEKQLDDVEEEAEKLSKEVSPFARMRQQAERDILEYTLQAKNTRTLLDEANLKYSVSSHWVKWFKDIRLTQIDEALSQLEVEVNNQVEALGLVDWEIRFGVDRETKGGTIQRGFSVTVKAPGSTKPVPWKSWSGGEKQRLIVAVQMGLANLVRARSGCQFDLEVWDEPTRGMSQQGVQDLMESLHTRARREKRQIWVVDHHTLGFNKFAGSVGVVKTQEGSSFQSDFDSV